MKNRRGQLVKSLAPHAIDALLVTNPTNITYLTRYKAEDAWLLVTKKGSFYVTDARYTQEVRQFLRGARVVEFKRSLGTQIFHLCKQMRVRRLGFNPHHLTVAQLSGLKKSAPKSLKLKASPGLVEAFRQIKDKEEIALTRMALRIHKEALTYVKRYIKPGNTEIAIKHKLEDFVRSRGVRFAFAPIVAAGVNSSFPHAKVSRRKIRKNDVVLIDMGIDVDGYKSDLTRMFFLGKIPNLCKDVCAHVSEAQRLAIQKIKPGVQISLVDQAARSYLQSQKLAKYFGHSLGHGVGLDIHEAPGVSSSNTNILKPGMIITVEPGVYLPGKFGIRLEEMVLVTAQGKRILSDHIHESDNFRDRLKV